MPMIQGIDGAALINAFRQGREDRYQMDARALDTEMKKRAAERQAQIDGLVGQVFGGEQGGVVANYGAQAPQQPAAMQAPSPTTSDVQAPVPARPMQPDQGAMQKLLILDPETGGKLASAFKTMDETQLARARAKNDMLGSAAMWLMKYPPEQRGQMLKVIAPQLVQAGWSPQEIAQTDLSNNGLSGYRALAIDYDKLIDNDLEERKFRAGDNVALVPGGGVANIRPQMDESGNFTGNTASTVIQPYGTGGSQGGVQEGATATNPQTRERLQFKGGQWVPMGGGASNGTGGFPSGQ